MPRYIYSAADGRLHKLADSKAASPKTAGEASTPVVVKEAEATTDAKGVVVAKIASIGILDRGGDVVTATSFGTQPQHVVMSAWNHSAFENGAGALPVGTGTVQREGDGIIFRGLLLQTTAARDVLELLRALGGRGLWSWGYLIRKFHNGKVGSEFARFLDDVEIFETSPVLRPMGYGTATVAVSGASPTRLQIERAQADNERELRNLQHPRYEEIMRMSRRAQKLGVSVPWMTAGRK